MDKSLSNFQIAKFFKDDENEELKKNYMGVYSMDKITKYINFYEIMKRKNDKYPFAIFNTDNHNEPGKRWWSFMDIYPPKNLFLFDSFGIGFIFFIVNDNKKIINELLYGLRKCEFKSKLCAMKFFVEMWQKMSDKVKE